MAPLVVLIDGHSLAYRAYYALLRQGLQTRKGEPTHAVYGFTSMLLKVWREHRPDYMAVAFDVGRTFRHEAFGEYKATRAERPSDFDVQMARIHQIIDAFAIPKLTAEGYEADDVIGTVAHQALQRGMEVLIVTGDTDAFQLIRPGIRVLTSRRHFVSTGFRAVAQNPVSFQGPLAGRVWASEHFEKSLNCLRPRGYMVLFGQSSGPVPPMDPQILNQKGSLFLTRPSMWHYLLTREELLWRAGEVLHLVATGQLKVFIDSTFPLEQAADAHRRLASRQTVGKVLLIP